MPIIPDTKDWTWVLESQCPQCEFDANVLSLADVAELLRTNASRWERVLERADARIRPDENTWSPLEYGAHVRDVHLVFRERGELMLARDTPKLADWDQNAAAADGRYSELDPGEIIEAIDKAAEASARFFDGIPVDARDRDATRSDGALFTVETLARYYAHDIVHHLWDVTHD